MYQKSIRRRLLLLSSQLGRAVTYTFTHVEIDIDI